MKKIIFGSKKYHEIGGKFYECFYFFIILTHILKTYLLTKKKH